MIFGGTKRVELRRVRPHVSTGNRVMVYVSSPVKALSGEFVVERIVTATPDALWSVVRRDAGISRRQYELYFEGAETAHAIFLSEPTPLSTPISLDTLRSIWRNFQPPQCYAYLDEGQVARALTHI
jgi:predicted transcriptional regulator